MRWFIVPLITLCLSACSGGYEDLKSPCVGSEGSPCDRRTPSQQWPA